ncbi:hypothetical protein WM30_24575 [Burkholderia ubonensis]|nr:hypothetical protein WM30_24575 [Burkholderia ubonensis]
MITDEVAKSINYQCWFLVGTINELRGLANVRMITKYRINATFDNIAGGFNDIDVRIHFELPSPVTIGDDMFSPFRSSQLNLLLYQRIIRGRIDVVESHLIHQVGFVARKLVTIEIEGER